MPDFGNLAHEAEDAAKSHSAEVDKGLDKATQEADQLAGGKDHGMIDKGEQGLEKELGTQPSPQGAGQPAAGADQQPSNP